MRVRKWATLRKKIFTPEEIEQTDKLVEKELLEMNLRALREFVGKSQEQVASTAKMNQSDLSKAERRQDHLLSTLRRFVEALGGELSVVATFGDKQIRLRGV